MRRKRAGPDPCRIVKPHRVSEVCTFLTDHRMPATVGPMCSSAPSDGAAVNGNGGRVMFHTQSFGRGVPARHGGRVVQVIAGFQFSMLSWNEAT